MIICGDALVELKKMEDNSVDFIFTDPPYNVGKDYGICKDNLSEIDYQLWMSVIVFECKRVSKNGVAFFVGSKRLLMFYNLLSDARCIIVRKGAIATPTPDLYYRQWSPLLVTRPPNERCYDVWEDIRMPGEGYYFRENRYPHPGLTSQRLTQRIIRFFTKKGEIICDPFCGTGTTAEVCKEFGLDFIGIEINPEYVEIANKRINEFEMLPFEQETADEK